MRFAGTKKYGRTNDEVTVKRGFTVSSISNNLFRVSYIEKSSQLLKSESYPLQYSCS